MVRDVYEYPSSTLREIVPHVEDFGSVLYKDFLDLKETLSTIGAVGLAANQIGIRKRICVMLMGNNTIMEFVNPVIVFKQGKLYSVESCVSIPNYTAIITRAQVVKVGYQTRDGRSGLMHFQDTLAIRAQHEIDHLNGILIKDYVDGSHGKSGGITAEKGKIE